MARTQLRPQNITKDGTPIVWTTVSSADDAEFYNDGTMVLLMRQTTGESLVVSFPITANIDGSTPDPRTYTLASGSGAKYIGIFPTHLYNDEFGRVMINLANLASSSAASYQLAVLNW